jgi:hypothetical protein
VTEEQVRAIGPAFARYLVGFERFFDPRSVEHLRAYGRGLLTDLPRKSVEPIALASGTAVRTLQEFLKDYAWDRVGARDELHRRVAAHLAAVRDSLGTVGLVDETSQVKKGTKTPGVQRQYLGCVGKVENGVVTVHVGVARGKSKTLLDADLFVPESWDANRPRCRAADIPDEVKYRPKWQLARDQVRRAAGHGVRFDWLTFDWAWWSSGSWQPTRMGCGGKTPEVTAEQVCRALNARCGELLARCRGAPLLTHTAAVIRDHQQRNQAARESKRRRNRLPKPLPP